MASRPAANRIFLSYSHESPEHRSRAYLLYKLLRENGVDAHGDFSAAPRDWAHWTDDEVNGADRVLVIASPGYRQQTMALDDEETGDADVGESGRGVRYEWRYIQPAIYKDNNRNTDKVICVLLPGMELSDVPPPLDAASRNHCRVDDLSLEGIAGLLRRIDGRTEYPEVPLGPWPDLPLPPDAMATNFRLVVEDPEGHVDPAITRAVVDDACRLADVSLFALGLDLDDGHGVLPLLPHRDVLGRWIRALRELVDARPSTVRMRIGLALRAADRTGSAVDLVFGETARAMHGVEQGEIVVVRSAAFHAAAGPDTTRFPPHDAYREMTRDRLGGPPCWIAIAGLPDCPRLPPLAAGTRQAPPVSRRSPSGDQYHVAVTIGSQPDATGGSDGR